MKQLIIIYFFTISIVGQDLHMELNNNGKLECLKITDSLNLSSNDIYEKTLKWITSAYSNDEQSIIESQIKGEMIKIQGVYSEPIELIFNWRIGYTIQIDIKENKTRMRIYDIILLNFKNYTYPMEIIVQNGKFRSGNEAVNYRAGADKEFNRVYKYYLKSLSNTNKPSDIW